MQERGFEKQHGSEWLFDPDTQDAQQIKDEYENMDPWWIRDPEFGKEADFPRLQDIDSHICELKDVRAQAWDAGDKGGAKYLEGAIRKMKERARKLSIIYGAMLSLLSAIKDIDVDTDRIAAACYVTHVAKNYTAEQIDDMMRDRV